jgi:hypothetical protein
VAALNENRVVGRYPECQTRTFQQLAQCVFGFQITPDAVRPLGIGDCGRKQDLPIALASELIQCRRQALLLDVEAFQTVRQGHGGLRAQHTEDRGRDDPQASARPGAIRATRSVFRSLAMRCSGFH